MCFKKTIKDIHVMGKVCLMRVDFNVKLDTKGMIVNDKRIRASLSTIYNLIGRGAKVVLISHLGRPKDKDPKTSLQVVVDRLKDYIQQKHIYLADLDDETYVRTCIDKLQNGEIMMLENIRRYPGEKNDPKGFGKYLASFGDIYINDGFGVSHRHHASVVGIAPHLPSVSGLLLADEIKYMKLTINKKQAHPFVAIIGGKKAEEKIGVLHSLIKKVDDVLLGGGIVNTFLKAHDCEIGKSFYEENMLDEVKEIMRSSMGKSCGLVLPDDLVVANSISPTSYYKSIAYDQIPPDMMAVDIGPQTSAKYTKILQKAGFILWIGPMGIYEISNFRKGNDVIMDAIATSDASSFIGGGDTIASIALHPKRYYISHTSTGGGATLMFLEYGTLPGIDVLDNIDTDKCELF